MLNNPKKLSIIAILLLLLRMDSLSAATYEGASTEIEFAYSELVDTAFVIKYSSINKIIKFMIKKPVGENVVFIAEEYESNRVDTISRPFFWNTITLFDTNAISSKIQFKDLDQDYKKEILISNYYQNDINCLFVIAYNSGSWKLSDFKLFNGEGLVGQNYFTITAGADTSVYCYKNSKLIYCPDKSILTDKVSTTKYMSWALNLRVRKSPKFRSEVAGKLTKYEVVDFQNKAVKSEACLMVRGMKINKGEWLKVKKSKELEGWVYSPYLTNVIEINDLRIYADENKINIQHKANKEIVWQDSIDVVIGNVDYQFIQGIDFLYIKPFIVLKPYSIEKNIVFNSLIVNMETFSLVAKFIGSKTIYGVSADHKHLLYRNPLDTDLFIYSLVDKKVIDRINPDYFHAWQGNQLVFFTKHTSNSPILNEEKLIEKTIWEGGNSKNTGNFDLQNSLLDED